MSLAAALALVVLLTSALIVAVTLRYLRAPAIALPPELVQRRRALREALHHVIERAPSRRPLVATEVPSSPVAGVVEARLLAGEPQLALEQAEAALVSDPLHPGSCLLLAKSLLYCDQIDTAMTQLERARSMGADGPLVDYLSGRLGHLRWVRRAHRGHPSVASSLIPPLITPLEALVAQLERHRRSSSRATDLWLASGPSTGGGGQSGARPTDRTLNPDQLSQILVEHYSSYFESLSLLLSAAQAEPSFGDALYHAARLALKIGLIDEGRTLLEKIEPLMGDSLDREAYQADLAEIRGLGTLGEERWTAATPTPPAPSPHARRASGLTVVKG
jgi:hypothetical protein